MQYWYIEYKAILSVNTKPSLNTLYLAAATLTLFIKISQPLFISYWRLLPRSYLVNCK